MPGDLKREEQNVKTRTSKAIGVAVSATAIALSVPLAVNAYAEPTTTPPVAEIPPDPPQGPDCGPFKEALPNWKTLANIPVSNALASIPDVSTFSQAISGQLNPAVNVASVFDNGPYVIFAPTNEAFAALPPEQLAMLRADPAALTQLVYYHAFLGLLGPPDDVKGAAAHAGGHRGRGDGLGGAISRSTRPPRSSAAVSRRRTPGST